VIGLLVAALSVGLASALGVALGAGTTTAALLLLLPVVLASFFGYAAGVLASAASFLSLNFFFTPPVHTFAVEAGEDVFALVVFLAVAAVIATLVARATEMRTKAEQGAREARIRLDITNRLMEGERPEAVAQGAVDALVLLFGLASCSLRLGALAATAIGQAEPGERLQLGAGPADVDLVLGRGRALSDDDRAVLEALVVGLGTALERVRLGAEAHEARLQAAVGRTRSGFLSAVSHNLRTPLAAIKASVSTLLAPDARLGRADERELLETIYSETDRLERLVTKVLDLSRIRAGGLEPDPQPVDLAGLAQTAIRRLRPVARGHLVRLDLPDDLPEVRLDVTMMEQVFLNLLENALRFAPPGSDIRVEGRYDDDGSVVVRVVDHGPGIPEADRERVFSEFARGDSRPEAPGTGLGLAIVRAMVVAHDGTVWCEETPGGGATLVFRVPA
jgi:two-component system sensor histidine kinase KdpD